MSQDREGATKHPWWAEMVTAAYFKRGRENEYLFFPRGSLGPGYELPGLAEYQTLRRRSARRMLAAFASITLVGSLFGLIWALIPAALALAEWGVFARRVTRGLRVSEERLSTSEGVVAYAAATPPWIRGTMAGISAALAVLGAVLLLARPETWWVGATALALGLVGLLEFAWLRRRRAVPD